MLFDGLFSPQAIAANWTESANARIPMLGEGLFPAKKKAGLDLKWIKGASGLPISLMPSAFDAQATYRDRIGVSEVKTEMPFFREGFKVKEEDRQNWLRVLDSKDPYAQQILSRVFDDARQLIDGALVVSERERMQLLFPVNGNVGISIQANGVDYTYNYDPEGAWKASNYFALNSGLWNDATNADPFDDIQTAKDAISAKTGADLRIMVMNKNTFKNLRTVKAIKDRYLSKSGAAFGYLTDAEIIEILKATSDLDGIILYDKQYRDENKVAHKYVPDGYVTLLPAGAIGNTWYGTTPEEADLMGKGTDADVALVETGIAITQIPTLHPVNLNTLASEIVLPSYERMDDVAVMKVL